MLRTRSVHIRLEAHDSLAQLIRRSRAALEGVVLFAKHLDGHVAFTQSAQFGHRVCMRRFEVTCMLCLVRELGAQHGPACFFRLVSREVCLRGVVGIEGGL